MMEQIYFADLVFEARDTIKSMPYFHGARFTALLRFALHKLNLKLEDICHSILPFRDGTSFIQYKDKLVVRLILNQTGISMIDKIVEAVNTEEVHGEFSSKTLQIVNVLDGVTKAAVKNLQFTPFNEDAIADEITALQLQKRFILNFYTPARLNLPANMKPSKATGKDKLCKENFFKEHSKIALAHIINSVKNLDEWPVTIADIENLPEPYSDNLTWQDLCYNKERQQPIGGFYGKVYFEGKIVSEEAAKRLVIGQYFGIGKNSRFGLGFYKINELDGVRNIMLPHMDY